MESCVRWRSSASVRSVTAASCEVWRCVAISRPKQVQRTATQLARAAMPGLVMPNTRRLIAMTDARCSPRKPLLKRKDLWVCFVNLTVLAGTSVKAGHTRQLLWFGTAFGHKPGHFLAESFPVQTFNDAL